MFRRGLLAVCECSEAVADPDISSSDVDVDGLFPAKEHHHTTTFSMAWPLGLG